MKVVHWGWYYLYSFLDDCSHYIIAWGLCQIIAARDVKQTLEIVIAKNGIKHVHVLEKPRLLLDSGSALLPKSLKSIWMNTR